MDEFNVNINQIKKQLYELKKVLPKHEARIKKKDDEIKQAKLKIK